MSYFRPARRPHRAKQSTAARRHHLRNNFLAALAREQQEEEGEEKAEREEEEDALGMADGRKRRDEGTKRRRDEAVFGTAQLMIHRNIIGRQLW